LSATCHQSHAYDDGACLYFTFAGRTSGDVTEFYRDIWDRASRTVVAAGGALSHHHGVGRNRACFVAEALGGSFEVLEAIKGVLDPHSLLNPWCSRPWRRTVVKALVIDVGTTSIRAACVDTEGKVSAIHQRALTVDVAPAR
jgi:hypothetical protein